MVTVTKVVKLKMCEEAVGSRVEMVTEACGGIVQEEGGDLLVQIVAAEATVEAGPCLSLSFLFSVPLFHSALTSMSPVSLGPISIPDPT